MHAHEIVIDYEIKLDNSKFECAEYIPSIYKLDIF